MKRTCQARRAARVLCLLPLFLLGAAGAAERGDGPDNRPAPGFDQAGSHPQAIALADRAMQAMGGRAAWDRARFLTWRFFGKRLHVWDRWTGDVRVEYDDRKSGARHVILMNVNTRKGRAYAAGAEVTDPEQQRALLQRGYELWVNDSYWLVMPYKLKDSGVTLRYKGAAPMQDGRQAEVVVLTFAGVGVTPQNKYDVYIARDTGLVEQWSFYESAAAERPDFTTPWQGWHRSCGIMLPLRFGKDQAHTDVGVVERLDEAVLRSPLPVAPAALTRGCGRPGG